METIPQRLALFPITIFGVIMGYSGLTLAFINEESLFHLFVPLERILIVATTLLFILFTSVYAIKWFKHPAAVKQEFANPVTLHFFPTFSISLILLSLMYQPFLPHLAMTMWWIGTLIQFSLLVYILNNWIHHEHWLITHMNPAWFIPVVGNIIVPLGAVHFANAELGWFFFSIGLIFWLILNSIVMYRLFFHTPLAKQLEPTLFILLAPPSVGFLSYIALQQPDSLDVFARILFYTALFLFLLLLSQTKRFINVPFTLSWWAYTFPLGAFSSAAFVMFRFLPNVVFASIAFFSLLLLSTLISYLTYRTLLAVYRRELCPTVKPNN